MHPRPSRPRRRRLGLALLVLGSCLAGSTPASAQPIHWTVKGPMPAPRAQLVAAVVNGKIYAIGGFQFQGLAPAVFTPVIEEYDPATLRVRDTQTGAVFTHTNPDLNPAPPIQATSALPCH